MSSGVAQRGSVRLAYRRRGTGPAVLLLPGLGLSQQMWMGLPSGLTRRGFTVVTMDHRGVGGSSIPRWPYRMSQLADDAAAVIEHVGGGPLIVVGISLGGMVAQHVALRHPRQVSGLVLAATAAGAPFFWPARPAIVRQLLHSFRGTALQRALFQRNLVHPQSLRQHPQLFRQWSRELRKNRPDPWGLWGQLWAAAGHSTGLRLRRLRCPTEVICGDGDVIIPPLNSQILAALIRDAQLTVIKQAGHAFPLEHPAALPLAIARVARRGEVSAQV